MTRVCWSGAAHLVAYDRGLGGEGVPEAGERNILGDWVRDGPPALEAGPRLHDDQ